MVVMHDTMDQSVVSASFSPLVFHEVCSTEDWVAQVAQNQQVEAENVQIIIRMVEEHQDEGIGTKSPMLQQWLEQAPEKGAWNAFSRTNDGAVDAQEGAISFRVLEEDMHKDFVEYNKQGKLLNASLGQSCIVGTGSGLKHV